MTRNGRRRVDLFTPCEMDRRRREDSLNRPKENSDFEYFEEWDDEEEIEDEE